MYNNGSYSDNKMRVKQEEPARVKQEPTTPEDMIAFTRKLCGLPPATQGGQQFYNLSPPQMIASPSPSQGAVPLRSPVPSPVPSPALTVAPGYGYYAPSAPGYLTAGYSGVWPPSHGPLHQSAHAAGEQGVSPQGGSLQFGGLGPPGATQEATVKDDFDSDDSCEFDDD